MHVFPALIQWDKSLHVHNIIRLTSQHRQYLPGVISFRSCDNSCSPVWVRKFIFVIDIAIAYLYNKEVTLPV